MSPIILLTPSVTSTSRNLSQFTLYQNYAEIIQQSGGIPIIPATGDREALRQLSKEASGLLLPGGGDIDPAYFHQSDESDGTEYDTWRDETELFLCRLFAAEKKPILGICRGFQLINVAFGGTLYQDIQKNLNHSHPNNTMHPVKAVRGSWWYNRYGESFLVNSFHHQAIASPGKDLIPTAYDPVTGIVEAFEHKTLPVTGVQWHPERMVGNHPYTPGGPDMTIYFQMFIEMCRKFV